MAAGLLCAASIEAQQETYDIKLTRPYSVGDKFLMKIKYSRIDSKEIYIGSNVLKEMKSEVSFDLSANAIVKQTDKSGGIKGLSAEVINFNVKYDGGEEDVLPKGARIEALVSDLGTFINVNGEKTESRIEDVLCAILPLSSGDPTDDEIYGTPDKKKAGEFWPIEHGKMAEALRTGSLKKDDIQGKSTLSKITKEGNVECMSVESSVDIKNIPVDLPYGHTLKTSSGTVRFSGKYPVAKSEKTIERETYLKVEGTGVYRNPVQGQELTTKVITEYSKCWQFYPPER